jgi:hypothetical protein
VTIAAANRNFLIILLLQFRLDVEGMPEMLVSSGNAVKAVEGSGPYTVLAMEQVRFVQHRDCRSGNSRACPSGNAWHVVFAVLGQRSPIPAVGRLISAEPN